MSINRKPDPPVFHCPSCGNDCRTGSGSSPTVCECGHPLEVRLTWGGGRPSRDSIDSHLSTLWRYGAVLPPLGDEEIVSMGEGWTPLVKGPVIRDVSVWFKDDSQNPTGSFKDRGMSLAVSHLKACGMETVCLPSAGNAGVSAAAFCQKAGIQCHVYLPEALPRSFVEEAKGWGARVVQAGLTLVEAAETMQLERKDHWFDLSTLKEPFRVEGKKTLGYEIAEQMNWKFPEVVVYPTGGGTGLIGMWKAFREMRELRWVDAHLPRMVAVQSKECAPVVKAFSQNSESVEPWGAGHTQALGLNAPAPLGGNWMLRVLRDSRGTAETVSEGDIESARRRLGQLSGTDPSPEGGVAWMGFEQLLDSGWIRPDEQVLIPITGSHGRYGA